MITCSSHAGPCVRGATGLLAAAALWSSCSLGGPSRVSPEEIPTLEARLAQEPNHPDVTLRYAAALFAADRCDSAVAVAQRGRLLRPDNSLGPLVIGQCRERGGRYEEALAVYASFLAEHEDATGAAAIRARQLIAQRANASAVARAALANEQNLAGQAPPTNAVAVMPLTIAGDSSYRPLARGIAQMITSDLGLLATFQLVERLQLRALLDELELSGTERVDQNTAARVGRLVRAGRLVQGLAVIPEDGDMRLEGTVVTANGEVGGANAYTGRFRDLLRLEKELVVGIAEQLGYQLSQAERQLILENGTRSLAAFLAYSRGLEAEELGDYSAATQYFSAAVRADPDFRDARTRHQANAVAQQAQTASASEVTTIAATDPEAPDATEAVVGAVIGAIGDLAPTQGEQTTEGSEGGQQSVEHVTRASASTTASQPKPPDYTPATQLTAVIRIVFRIP